MTPDNSSKQCCIFDTISLVSLCRVEIGRKRAIQWLLDDFIVLLPKKVFQDGRRHLSEDDDERTIFFKDILERQQEPDDHFTSSMDHHVKRLPPDKRPNMDEGETIAAALALEMSRLNQHYVILITDDYKAKPLLECICDIDQVGLVKNSYDLLLFIGGRHSDEVPLDEIRIALGQLNYLLRDNNKPAHQKQKPDELFEEYLASYRTLTPALPRN